MKIFVYGPRADSDTAGQSTAAQATAQAPAVVSSVGCDSFAPFSDRKRTSLIALKDSLVRRLRWTIGMAIGMGMGMEMGMGMGGMGVVAGRGAQGNQGEVGAGGD